MKINTYVSAYEEYQKLEERYGDGYNRKCIDGRITGCGKCVGFCKYAGHSGFLTERHRLTHQCVEKGCKYYTPKPGKIRMIMPIPDPEQALQSLVRKAVSDMDGLKVTRIHHDNGSWIANYVTISNEYDLVEAEKAVRRQSGLRFSFHRLNLDFDTCARIIMGV